MEYLKRLGITAEHGFALLRAAIILIAAFIAQGLLGPTIRRIKQRFDELGIEIPFPHMSLYFGEASKPIAVQGAGLDREELKWAVREVPGEAGVLKPGA